MTAEPDVTVSREAPHRSEVGARRGPTRLGVALAILQGTLIGLYPVGVWVALTYFSPRVVGLVVLAITVPNVALRAWRADRATFWSIVRIPLVVLAFVATGVLLDDARYVLAMPVLINTALLVQFGATLRAGAVPMIERFARMEDPALTPPKQQHCRTWTWAWSAFFALNAATSATLALAAPLAWWATWTGLLAYVAMGALFATEYIVRKIRFRDFGAGPLDRALSRLLPARAPAPSRPRRD